MSALLPFMAHALTVALLVGAAAWVAERGLRRAGLAVRWVWLAALVLSAGLSIRAAVWTPSASEAVPVRSAQVEGPVGSGAAASMALPDMALPAPLHRRAVERIERELAHAIGVVPPAATRALALTWMIGTGSLLGLLLLSGARMARLRRRWPRFRVGGQEIRLSGRLGPAVVGIRRPEIVLPRWVLGLTPSDVDLVLLHEGEHVASRDTLLLAVGLATLVAFVWNPVLWWQFARLREAVEVDCDARVLRSGASRVAYGKVLLRVGGSQHRGLDVMPALGGSSSLLERRLMHMTRKTKRVAWPLGIAAVGVAASLVVLACELDRPVSAPEGALDADQIAALTEAVEGAAPSEERVPPADGSEVLAESTALLRQDPARPDAGGTPPPNQVEVLLQGPRPHHPDPSLGIGSTELRRETTILPSLRIEPTEVPPEVIIAPPSGTPDTSAPLYIVDGVIVSEMPMRELDPGAIESIEVLKGAAAARLYGSRATNGVVQIRTKKADPGGD